MIRFPEPGDATPSGLDEETVDRRLSGQFAPHDAPHGYAQVAELIQVTQSGLARGDSFWEPDVIGAMAAAVTSSATRETRRRTVIRRPLRRAATGAAAAMLVLSSGTAAAAAAGTLPTAIRGAVSKAVGALHIAGPGARHAARTESGVGTGPPATLDFSFHLSPAEADRRASHHR
jgi:hypothetical protein